MENGHAKVFFPFVERINAKFLNIFEKASFLLLSKTLNDHHLKFHNIFKTISTSSSLDDFNNKENISLRIFALSLSPNNQQQQEQKLLFPENQIYNQAI